LFRAQVELSLKYSLPLYLHIRNSFEDSIQVLEEEFSRYHLASHHTSSPSVPPGVPPTLNSWNEYCPPCVVHCFTGTLSELRAYVSYGWYIGLTGSIMNISDEELFSFLSIIPLQRLLIETDAPYLGWKGCRVSESSKKSAKYPNVPAALPIVLRRIVTVLSGKVSYEELAKITTENSFRFCQRSK
jgi:TatD DNase family protein